MRGRRARGWDAPGALRLAGRGLVVDRPGVARGHVVADRLAVAERPLLADHAVVADGPAVTRRTVYRPAVARRCVVAGRAAGWLAVLTGRPPGRGVVASGPPRAPVVAGRAGWAVFADRAAVADRRVVRRWHLARLPVAGRLPAPALLRWRRRLLAADRARGAVTPLRGLSAFAPRTTRTLGW
ncbi:hypothetical protein SAMN05421837_1046 [Amycolatopsis pretoriensis]|uniref:Uncharacterized protein n=1 Tax=Amycolatopsis pretoriensis TaxID=218821 RepID=A0A1H5QPR3_9PSEU|nr:hypothetical protein SAMN05421837_1046 [Amycolatopsis pretoriensis]